jgi:hypothetical protein
MPWRVIDTDGEVWHVQAAAERRANERLWQLMLAFRVASAERTRSFWAPYPLESVSKSSLFLQADRLSDEDLREVIAQHRS